MKRRQLKWFVLLIISGSIGPLLIYKDAYGLTVTWISILSWCIFMFSTIMFALTQYNTVKEILSAVKFSFKIECE